MCHCHGLQLRSIPSGPNASPTALNTSSDTFDGTSAMFLFSTIKPQRILDSPPHPTYSCYRHPQSYLPTAPIPIHFDTTRSVLAVPRLRCRQPQDQRRYLEQVCHTYPSSKDREPSNSQHRPILRVSLVAPIHIAPHVHHPSRGLFCLNSGFTPFKSESSPPP